MLRAFDRASLALITFLALAVGLISLRYLAPDIPLAAPNVMANRFANHALVLHAGLGATALLLGPLQFFRRTDGRRAAWHRVTGAAYMVACLVSAPAGLVLALGVSTGPVAGTGFGLLAVAWFWTTASGLRSVLTGRYAEHGRWMLRSFALTFAAVTLRLYMPLAAFLPVSGEDAYRAIAYLCWIPNLLLAEALLRSRFSSRLPAAAGR